MKNEPNQIINEIANLEKFVSKVFDENNTREYLQYSLETLPSYARTQFDDLYTKNESLKDLILNEEFKFYFRLFARSYYKDNRLGIKDFTNLAKEICDTLIDRVKALDISYESKKAIVSIKYDKYTLLDLAFCAGNIDHVSSIFEVNDELLLGLHNNRFFNRYFGDLSESIHEDSAEMLELLACILKKPNADDLNGLKDSMFKLLIRSLRSNNLQLVRVILDNYKDFVNELHTMNNNDISYYVRSVDMLQELIKHGLSLNQLDEQGTSYAYYIVQAFIHRNFYKFEGYDLNTFQQLLEVLLDNQAVYVYKNNDLLLSADKSDKSGRNKLHYAVLSSDYVLASMILKKYPKAIEALDKNGKSPIFYAWNVNLLNLLLKNKANINLLDEAGNSPLYCYYKNNHNNEFIKKLIESGAMSIRAGKEEKTSLHFLSLMDDFEWKDEYAKIINKVDLERKRTALHYTTCLNKIKNSKILIENGASCVIRDLFGKNALDYACIAGNYDLVYFIIQSSEKSGLDIVNHKLEHANTEKYNEIFSKQQKITYLIESCYSGSVECYNLIKSRQTEFSKLEELINSMIQEKSLNFEKICDFDIEDQLIIISAVVTLLNNDAITVESSNYVGKLLKNISENISPSWAIGVEVEIPDLMPAPFLPKECLLSWFKIFLIDDTSVFQDMFMKEEYQEISCLYPCRNKSDLELFAQALHYLQVSGSVVNYSSALQIHFNIKGSFRYKNLYSISEGDNEIELQVIKQIYVNWCAIEPFLLAFLRGGEGYNENGHIKEYACPVNGNLANVLSAKKLEELRSGFEYYDSPARTTALNVESLFKHGTIEFRLFESTINPVLFKATINFINRLTNISIDQVHERNKVISSSSDNSFKPYENITDLVYIFLAERKYRKTWDAIQKSPYGTSIPPAVGDKPIQVSMQESLLFRGYNHAARNKSYENIIKNGEPEEIPFLQQDIERMIKLNKDYPGIFTNAELTEEPSFKQGNNKSTQTKFSKKS